MQWPGSCKESDTGPQAWAVTETDQEKALLSTPTMVETSGRSASHTCSIRRHQLTCGFQQDWAVPDLAWLDLYKCKATRVVQGGALEGHSSTSIVFHGFTVSWLAAKKLKHGSL